MTEVLAWPLAVCAWGAGGLAGVIPGSILSAGSQGCAPVARPRVGRHPRHVDGHNDRVTTVAVIADARDQQSVKRRQRAFSDTASRSKKGFLRMQKQKTRSGGDDRACLARSLRAEKASSVAYESRFAWLTRILLPPEPQAEPYIGPPPTLQPPRTPNPAK